MQRKPLGSATHMPGARPQLEPVRRPPGEPSGRKEELPDDVQADVHCALILQVTGKGQHKQTNPRTTSSGRR